MRINHHKNPSHFRVLATVGKRKRLCANFNAQNHQYREQT